MTEIVKSFTSEEIGEMLINNPLGFCQMMAKVLVNVDTKIVNVEAGIVNLQNGQIELKNGQIELKKDHEHIITTGDANLDATNKILKIVSHLDETFKNIKLENRSDDNKILLLTNELDKFDKNLNKDKLDIHVAICQQDCLYWDEYHELTHQYLPLADYLYSQLSNLNSGDFVDYSPVILELCRAVENEYLRKIFEKYTKKICSCYLSFTELQAFLGSENTVYWVKKKMSKPTVQFSTAIKDYYKSGRCHKYTLGTMSFILKMLNDTDLVSQSPLLLDFKKYLETETNYSNLLDNEYLKKLDKIVNDYRNPSAHPEVMCQNLARECKDGIPDNLDHLIECLLSVK